MTYNSASALVAPVQHFKDCAVRSLSLMDLYVKGLAPYGEMQFVLYCKVWAFREGPDPLLPARYCSFLPPEQATPQQLRAPCVNHPLDLPLEGTLGLQGALPRVHGGPQGARLAPGFVALQQPLRPHGILRRAPPGTPDCTQYPPARYVGGLRIPPYPGASSS